MQQSLHLLIIMLFTNGIYAQAQDSLVKNNDLKRELLEVVVTGQISETTAENSIHKIRIIGSKELNSGLFLDLGSALSKELNINLTQDNILGSSVSIQGISGQNVKILIDDVPVIGRLNGNIDLSQISLSNIDRIEIIEGPLSTIYGTDALAGTINIITKKDSKSKKVLNSYYETIGKYNYDLIISNNINNHTATYQLGRNYFNGWSNGQEFNLLPTSEIADERRHKQWKPKEQIFHKISYNIDEDTYSNNNYIERFYEKITNKGMPQGPYLENAFDEYYHTSRTNMGSDIKMEGEKYNTQLILAYNQYVRTKETFYKNLTNLSEFILDDPSKQDTSEFNLWIAKMIISNSINKKIKYQLGLDLNMQNAKGRRILDKYQEKRNYAAFSTIEYELNPQITLRPSARVIYNTKYKAPFIPAINILFDYEEYKFRASYAKGFRAPDFKELFFEFIDVNHNIVGNENLLAETSNNYNLNTTISKEIFQKKVITDISLFYNEISNKIDLANSLTETNQYSYFNITNYATKGISFRTSISLPNTQINVGASHIGRHNNISSEYNMPQFSFSTDMNLSALFTLGNKTKLNIFFNNTGKLPIYIMENENITEGYSESYNILDCSINRRIFNDLLIITIGGKNLFNITNIKKYNNNSVHSTSSNNVPVGYGRTFFTNLKFNL